MVLLALLAMAIGGLLVLSLVLVGLFEAPWPILLVGLLAALYGLQRLLPEGQGLASLAEVEPASPVAEPQPGQEQQNRGKAAADNDMLTYRGIRYRTAQPHDAETHTAEPSVEGIYRGQHWQRGADASADSQSSAAKASEITYRGHKIIKPKPEA